MEIYPLHIRLELSGPGVQFISNNQLYSIITAHALLMIFFMVMPSLIGGLFDVDDLYVCETSPQTP